MRSPPCPRSSPGKTGTPDNTKHGCSLLAPTRSEVTNLVRGSLSPCARDPLLLEKPQPAWRVTKAPPRLLGSDGGVSGGLRRWQGGATRFTSQPGNGRKRNAIMQSAWKGGMTCLRGNGHRRAWNGSDEKRVEPTWFEPHPGRFWGKSAKPASPNENSHRGLEDGGYGSLTESNLCIYTSKRYIY